MYEYELEALPELEGEYEYQGEWESEEFLSNLRQLAGRAADWGRRQLTPGSPLRRVAFGTARQVVRQGLPALGAWAGRTVGSQAGGALGGLVGPEGVPVGRAAGGAVGGTLGRQLGQEATPTVLGWIPEQEYEFELEEELESEMNPLRRVYPDALMEHLGHAAAAAESEAEAEAFIGALIPLAGRLIPRAAPAIMRAAPGLIRGLSSAARTLRRNPITRPLVRTLPTVIRRTAASVAQQAAQGQPVTPQSTVRTLARQTAQVLSSPRQCAQAYQRSRTLDRRYHRTAGAPTMRSAAAG